MKIKLIKLCLLSFMLFGIAFADENSFDTVLRQTAKLRKSGDYSKAYILLSNALNNISAKTNNILKAKIYNNLALVKIYQGDFSEAEKLLKTTLRLRREIYDTNSLVIANTLNNLGSLFGRIGKYSEAEPLFLEALEIRKNNLEKSDYKIAESLNNLAAVYHVQEKYRQAENLFREALDIIEKNDDKLNLAAVLNNLGTVCFYQKKYSDAIKFHKRALKIRQQIAGENSPVTAESLFNISKVYNSISNYFKAEKLCERALQIRENSLGENHPEYAETLTLLAKINLAENKYAKAEPLLKKSLEIKQKMLENNHPDVIESLVELASLYEGEKKYNAAANCFFDTINFLESAVNNAGGENYSSQYRKKQRKLCGNFLRVLTKANTNSEIKTENAFTAMELTRARLFLDELSTAAAGKFAGLSASEIEKIENLRKKLNIAEKKDDREIEISKLKAQLSKLEKNISKKYPGYQKIRNTKIVKLHELIADVLKTNEALISYWLDKNNLSGVVIQNGRADFISIPVNIKNVYIKIAELIDMLEEEASCNDYKKLSGELYKIFLAPFVKNIDFSNVETLFIIPSGILSAVPFEALTVTDQGDNFNNLDYFFKKTFISYIPSATILKMVREGYADEENINYAKLPLLAFGDPIYTKKQAAVEGKKDETEYTLNLKVKDNLLALVAQDNTIGKKLTRNIKIEEGNSLLVPLPGTRREISEIDKIFYGSVSNSHTFLGGKAQESIVKKLNEQGDLTKYKFIHFATHGFLPGEVSGLAEPCLVLSLFGKNENEDGFLKMSEIINMQINAELITLSSCNSGVVEPDEYSEGISGLARSFFFAGSKSVLVTLWSIDDNATIIFMKNLYKKLNDGEPINRAMYFARKQMLRGEYAYPGFWAAYVLNGEINFNRR